MTDRLEILQKIESGELSPEVGLAQLNKLDSAGTPPAEVSEPAPAAPVAEVIDPPADSTSQAKPDLPEFSGFRYVSWILFGAFLILTVISANWMIQGWLAHPFGWGFWLSWFPFALGILGMATSLNSRWLHVRVTSKKAGSHQNVRVSLPLPLGIASWLLRMNPGWLPQQVRDQHIGETLHELNKGITRDQPFFVEVDEEDEHVEVYIG